MADFDSDKRRKRFQREASRKRRQIVRQTWVYKFERQQRRLERQTVGVTG